MYEKQILKILTDAGDKGLKVAKIARHVYNDCNSLFETQSFEEVHQAVLAFLNNNAKTKEPLIEKVKWGVYRINRNSKKFRQLILEFRNPDEQADTDSGNPRSDKTLSLFDDV